MSQPDCQCRSSKAEQKGHRGGETTKERDSSSQLETDGGREELSERDFQKKKGRGDQKNGEQELTEEDDADALLRTWTHANLRTRGTFFEFFSPFWRSLSLH